LGEAKILKLMAIEGIIPDPDASANLLPLSGAGTPKGSHKPKYTSLL
jgi:hypothetical protein